MSIVENPIGENGERSDKYKCSTCGHSPSFLYGLTLFTAVLSPVYFCKTCLGNWIQRIDKAYTGGKNETQAIAKAGSSQNK